MEKIPKKMKIINIIILRNFILLGFILFNTPIYSQNTSNEWLSLKYNKTYIRTGPSKMHKVLWAYKKSGLPIKKIRKKGDWYEVLMPDNVNGWVNESQISKKRKVIILHEQLVNIYKKESSDSEIIAKAGKNITGELIGCKNLFCKIDFYQVEGFVEKKFLWGIN